MINHKGQNNFELKVLSFSILLIMNIILYINYYGLSKGEDNVIIGNCIITILINSLNNIH